MAPLGRTIGHSPKSVIDELQLLHSIAIVPVGSYPLASTAEESQQQPRTTARLRVQSLVEALVVAPVPA